MITRREMLQQLGLMIGVAAGLPGGEIAGAWESRCLGVRIRKGRKGEIWRSHAGQRLGVWDFYHNECLAVGVTSSNQGAEVPALWRGCVGY